MQPQLQEPPRRGLKPPTTDVTIGNVERIVQFLCPKDDTTVANLRTLAGRVDRQYQRPGFSFPVEVKRVGLHVDADATVAALSAKAKKRMRDPNTGASHQLAKIVEMGLPPLLAALRRPNSVTVGPGTYAKCCLLVPGDIEPLGWDVWRMYDDKEKDMEREKDEIIASRVAQGAMQDPEDATRADFVRGVVHHILFHGYPVPIRDVTWRPKVNAYANHWGKYSYDITYPSHPQRVRTLPFPVSDRIWTFLREDFGLALSVHDGLWSLVRVVDLPDGEPVLALYGKTGDEALIYGWDSCPKCHAPGAAVVEERYYSGRTKCIACGHLEGWCD